ncbi:MAG: hypothetical protein CL926_13625 [Deltaproteobacteria bacterium]|nr:hypothetical protein [Deltaproteobacteria bacterium]
MDEKSEKEKEKEDEMSEQEKVDQFCYLCDVDESTAREQLESAGWDMQQAMDKFEETDEEDVEESPNLDKELEGLVSTETEKRVFKIDDAAADKAEEEADAAITKMGHDGEAAAMEFLEKIGLEDWIVVFKENLPENCRSVSDLRDTTAEDLWEMEGSTLITGEPMEMTKKTIRAILRALGTKPGTDSIPGKKSGKGAAIDEELVIKESGDVINIGAALAHADKRQLVAQKQPRILPKKETRDDDLFKSVPVERPRNVGLLADLVRQTPDRAAASLGLTGGDGSGQIGFDEFRDLFHRWQDDEEALLREVELLFNDIDEDGAGQLERVEVRQLMDMLGFAVFDADIDGAMDEMDTDRDGAVNFDEFATWFSSAKEKADELSHQKVKEERERREGKRRKAVEEKVNKKLRVQSLVDSGKHPNTGSMGGASDVLRDEISPHLRGMQKGLEGDKLEGVIQYTKDQMDQLADPAQERLDDRRSKISWEKKKGSDACNLCHKKFRSGKNPFKTGKHHCKACGSLVCADCSKGMLRLKKIQKNCNRTKDNRKWVRVCNYCFKFCSGIDKEYIGEFLGSSIRDLKQRRSEIEGELQKNPANDKLVHEQMKIANFEKHLNATDCGIGGTGEKSSLCDGPKFDSREKKQKEAIQAAVDADKRSGLTDKDMVALSREASLDRMQKLRKAAKPRTQEGGVKRKLKRKSKRRISQRSQRSKKYKRSQRSKKYKRSQRFKKYKRSKRSKKSKKSKKI